MSFDGDPTGSGAKPSRWRLNISGRWPGKRPLVDSSRLAFLRTLAKYLVRDIVWLGAVGVCASTLGLASVFLYLNPQIPTTETYRHYRFETPLRIFTADGALVAEFGNRLIPIDFDDVPKDFVNALLNTEDKRFYDHAGIDLISLANDVVDLFLSDVRTGASTVTMQLAKQVSFGPEQLMIRKLKEMLLALKIERELTKDEILELYVNIMAFGKQAYGVQAAAHTYYGRPVEELNLAQLAMLAGIIKKPTAGNPINGPEWALDRRNLVLRRMRSQDSIDETAYQEAVASPITAAVHQRGIDLPAPYPAEWVRQQLIERYGTDIYTGFVVHTTLDSKRQAVAQRALRNGVLDYDIRHGFRGPEGRLALDALTVGEGGTLDASAVGEALDAFGTSGGLEPAVVVQIGERRIEVMRVNGEIVGIDWDGLRWAPYLDTDRRGPTPQRAAEIVSRGDVIRVLLDQEGAWRLRQLPEVQAAFVALDPRTGAIEALVGGWDFQATQFNHALQAARQPGSGFKPFVYSAALANGVTPSSMFLNAPLVFEDDNLEMVYRPRNDSGEFSGPMRLREALAQSINMVSMRVMTSVGADPVLDHVGNFGFETANLPNDVQLAIGGGTMLFTPLDMARAYAVFANGGFLIEPNIISRVERLDGSLVFEGRHPEACEPCVAPDDESPAPLSARRVIDEANAFIMDTLLRDVITHPRGTGRRARELDRPDLAGKTGTTDQSTDTWFNGYHPSLATTVWVGFSDHRPTGEGEYGSRTPLTIWMDFIRVALAEEPVVERPIPDGVVRVKVNKATGRVARPDDANALFEYFLGESLPERAPGDAGGEERTRVRPEDIF